MTGEFLIKRKMPLGIKLITATAIIGTTAYFLTNSIGTAPNETISDPPTTPPF